MKIIRLLIIPFFMIGLISCNNQNHESGKPYIVALEELMVQDEGLNDGMEFIAIDMTALQHLSMKEKERITNYFEETYHLEVKVATFEELKEQGYFDENTAMLAGILLRIEDIEHKSGKKIIINGTKYRSGLGAIGMEIVIENQKDDWVVTSSKILWIS